MQNVTFDGINGIPDARCPPPPSARSSGSATELVYRERRRCGLFPNYYGITESLWFLVVLTEDQEELTPGLGGCGWTLTIISWLLIGMTFPVSLCICLKVVSLTTFDMLVT